MHTIRRQTALLVCLLLFGAGSAQAQSDTLVVLVRHAEKATAPEADPDLTPAGNERARALASALAQTRIDAIITTQFKRTRQTAAPLAQALALTPAVVKAGGKVADHAREIAAAVRARPAGSAVLVVGHSNTVPAIIAALGGPRLAELCDGEYSSLFVLILRADGAVRFIRSSYGAPDPPSSTPCGKSMQVPGMRP